MKNEKIDKLNSLISEEKSGWLDKAKWREENEAWLDISFAIAVKILGALRENKKYNNYPKNQKELAEAMDCSPQYINKVLKGAENLQLETISKIGKILHVPLIEVAKSERFAQEFPTLSWAAESLPSYFSTSQQTAIPKVRKGIPTSRSKTQKIEQKGMLYTSMMNQFIFEEDFNFDPYSPLKIVA